MLFRSVGQLKDNAGGPIRVQSVPDSKRAAVQQSAKQISSLRNERLQLESKGTASGSGRVPGATGPAAPDRVNLARLPSFQNAGTRTAGPPTQGRPTQRVPNGTARAKPRPDGQDRQDRPDFEPRQDFQSRSDFPSRQDFPPRSDFQSRQGTSGRSPRFDGPRGGR